MTTDGRVVGTTTGIERFTIGQRKGLGIALGEPAFVVRIEPLTRRVIVGSKEELGRSELTADHCNWLVAPPSGSFRCSAKIRYNSPPLQPRRKPSPAIAYELSSMIRGTASRRARRSFVTTPTAYSEAAGSSEP